MTLILQGNDVLRYHPETGLPLTAEDFTITEMADGRTIYHIGDINNQLNGDQT